MATTLDKISPCVFEQNHAHGMLPCSTLGQQRKHEMDTPAREKNKNNGPGFYIHKGSTTTQQSRDTLESGPQRKTFSCKDARSPRDVNHNKADTPCQAASEEEQEREALERINYLYRKLRTAAESERVSAKPQIRTQEENEEDLDVTLEPETPSWSYESYPAWERRPASLAGLKSYIRATGGRMETEIFQPQDLPRPRNESVSAFVENVVLGKTFENRPRKCSYDPDFFLDDGYGNDEEEEVLPVDENQKQQSSTMSRSNASGLETKDRSQNTSLKENSEGEQIRRLEIKAYSEHAKEMDIVPNYAFCDSAKAKESLDFQNTSSRDCIHIKPYEQVGSVDQDKGDMFRTSLSQNITQDNLEREKLSSDHGGSKRSFGGAVDAKSIFNDDTRRYSNNEAHDSLLIKSVDEHIKQRRGTPASPDSYYPLGVEETLNTPTDLPHESVPQRRLVVMKDKTSARVWSKVVQRSVEPCWFQSSGKKSAKTIAFEDFKMPPVRHWEEDEVEEEVEDDDEDMDDINRDEDVEDATNSDENEDIFIEVESDEDLLGAKFEDRNFKIYQYKPEGEEIELMKTNMFDKSRNRSQNNGRNDSDDAHKTRKNAPSKHYTQTHGQKNKNFKKKPSQAASVPDDLRRKGLSSHTKTDELNKTIQSVKGPGKFKLDGTPKSPQNLNKSKSPPKKPTPIPLGAGVTRSEKKRSSTPTPVDNAFGEEIEIPVRYDGKARIYLILRTPPKSPKEIIRGDSALHDKKDRKLFGRPKRSNSPYRIRSTDISSPNQYENLPGKMKFKKKNKMSQARSPLYVKESFLPKTCAQDDDHDLILENEEDEETDFMTGVKGETESEEGGENVDDEDEGPVQPVPVLTAPSPCRFSRYRPCTHDESSEKKVAPAADVMNYKRMMSGTTSFAVKSSASEDILVDRSDCNFSRFQPCTHVTHSPCRFSRYRPCTHEECDKQQRMAPSLPEFFSRVPKTMGQTKTKDFGPCKFDRYQPCLHESVPEVTDIVETSILKPSKTKQTAFRTYEKNVRQNLVQHSPCAFGRFKPCMHEECQGASVMNKNVPGISLVVHNARSKNKHNCRYTPFIPCNHDEVPKINRAFGTKASKWQEKCKIKPPVLDATHAPKRSTTNTCRYSPFSPCFCYQTHEAMHDITEAVLGQTSATRQSPTLAKLIPMSETEEDDIEKSGTSSSTSKTTQAASDSEEKNIDANAPRGDDQGNAEVAAKNEEDYAPSLGLLSRLTRSWFSSAQAQVTRLTSQPPALVRPTLSPGVNLTQSIRNSGLCQNEKDQDETGDCMSKSGLSQRGRVPIKRKKSSPCDKAPLCSASTKRTLCDGENNGSGLELQDDLHFSQGNHDLSLVSTKARDHHDVDTSQISEIQDPSALSSFNSTLDETAFKTFPPTKKECNSYPRSNIEQHPITQQLCKQGRIMPENFLVLTSNQYEGSPDQRDEVMSADPLPRHFSDLAKVRQVGGLEAQNRYQLYTGRAGLTLCHDNLPEHLKTSLRVGEIIKNHDTQKPPGSENDPTLEVEADLNCQNTVNSITPSVEHNYDTNAALFSNQGDVFANPLRNCQNTVNSITPSMEHNYDTNAALFSNQGDVFANPLRRSRKPRASAKVGDLSDSAVKHADKSIPGDNMSIDTTNGGGEQGNANSQLRGQHYPVMDIHQPQNMNHTPSIQTLQDSNMAVVKSLEADFGGQLGNTRDAPSAVHDSGHPLLQTIENITGLTSKDQHMSSLDNSTNVSDEGDANSTMEDAHNNSTTRSSSSCRNTKSKGWLKLEKKEAPNRTQISCVSAQGRKPGHNIHRERKNTFLKYGSVKKSNAEKQQDKTGPRSGGGLCRAFMVSQPQSTGRVLGKIVEPKTFEEYSTRSVCYGAGDGGSPCSLDVEDQSCTSESLPTVSTDTQGDSSRSEKSEKFPKTEAEEDEESSSEDESEESDDDSGDEIDEESDSEDS